MICPRDAARLDFCAGLKVAGMRGPFQNREHLGAVVAAAELVIAAGAMAVAVTAARVAPSVPGGARLITARRAAVCAASHLPCWERMSWCAWSLHFCLMWVR